MTEAMKALDEIEAALAEAATELKVAHEALSEYANILSREPYEANRAYDAMSDVQAAGRCLPTLRAALAPPADGEVDAIRQRHEAVTPKWQLVGSVGIDAHADRATLLDRDTRHVAEIARLSAELAAERARRVEVDGALDVLQYHAQQQLDYMDMCGDKGDLERNLRAALERAATLTKDTP